MRISKTINYILIILGGAVALYAQAEASQNTYILIGGIVMLMTGIYRTSRNISSKHEHNSNEEEE